MVKRVREEWLDLARKILIRDGIESVTVQTMSRKLGVTKGGFYGYFGSRRAILQRLLKDWQEANTHALRRIVMLGQGDGSAQFSKLVDMWIEGEGYSPEYDAAVRDWARRSPSVAQVVRRVDKERIDLITRIFRNLGFLSDEARIRARVTYYHQVGYYALAVPESRSIRRRQSPKYALVLAGPKVSNAVRRNCGRRARRYENDRSRLCP